MMAGARNSENVVLFFFYVAWRTVCFQSLRIFSFLYSLVAHYVININYFISSLQFPLYEELHVFWGEGTTSQPVNGVARKY